MLLVVRVSEGKIKALCFLMTAFGSPLNYRFQTLVHDVALEFILLIFDSYCFFRIDNTFSLRSN